MRLRSNVAAVVITLVSAASALAQGYVCAEGGGTGSGDWSKEMFRWMVEKGNKGPAIIIGAVELDASDKPDSRESLLRYMGASSVKSLVVTAENADTQETYDAIAGASIVFIRGGSQSRYVEMWKGTKTEKAIHAVFDNGGVVGGSSAGCAVLGEITYDARHGSLKAEEAVRDARHPDLTLTKDFLGLVPGVLFDTHFGERARLPRLALMLAHCREDLHAEPLGIGLDPRTALCVNPDGTAEVKGEGYATFLELMPGTRAVLERGQPPVVTSMFMTMAPSGARFDLKTREFTTARTGRIRDSLAGMRTMAVAGDGPVTVVDQTPIELAQERWMNLSGWRDAGVYCSVSAYQDSAETMGGVTRLLTELSPQRIILLTSGTEALTEGAKIEFRPQEDRPAASAVVIDIGCVRETFEVGSSRTGVALPHGKAGLYKAKLHLLPPGWELDFDDGTPMRTVVDEARSKATSDTEATGGAAITPVTGP